MSFEFRNVKEHVEVYLNGRFLVSADNRLEAEQECARYEKEGQ